MRKHLTLTTLTLALSGFLFGLGTLSPSAHAAPAPAKPAAGAMPDLLSGKLYPNTLKRAELALNYHYITLIDAQGKSAECATKGDTVTLAGETFLVAYLLFDAPKPVGPTDAVPPPPDAQLTLINMHYVQALGGIRDTPTPPPAPAPGAAPTAAPTTGAATP